MTKKIIPVQMNGDFFIGFELQNKETINIMHTYSPKIFKGDEIKWRKSFTATRAIICLTPSRTKLKFTAWKATTHSSATTKVMCCLWAVRVTTA